MGYEKTSLIFLPHSNNDFQLQLKKIFNNVKNESPKFTQIEIFLGAGLTKEFEKIIAQEFNEQIKSQ